MQASQWLNTFALLSELLTIQIHIEKHMQITESNNCAFHFQTKHKIITFKSTRNIFHIMSVYRMWVKLEVFHSKIGESFDAHSSIAFEWLMGANTV